MYRMESYRSFIKGITPFSPAEAFIQVRIFVLYKCAEIIWLLKYWKELQSQHFLRGLEDWDFLCEQAFKSFNFIFLMQRNHNWKIAELLRKTWLSTVSQSLSARFIDSELGFWVDAQMGATD